MTDATPTKSTRLTPTPATLRSLYLKSGNQCALPNCTKQIIGSDGVYYGKVAHIVAAEKGGPRGDSPLDPEGRRAESNLMLLCANSHEAIDQDVETHTVEVLTEWKRQHEQKFATLLGDMMSQFVDSTTGSVVTYPTSLAQVGVDVEHFDEELERYVDFGNTLASLSTEARAVLACTLRHARNFGSDHWEVEAAQVEGALSPSLSHARTGELLMLLDGRGFVHIDADVRPIAVHINLHPLRDEPLRDLLELPRSTTKPDVFERVIQDLDLTAFD